MNVETLLREEHDAACREARPPAAGVVWFRASRRRRDEAARAADRPVTVVHAIAGACAVGVAAGLLQILALWLRQGISNAGGLGRLTGFDIAAAAASPATWVAAGAIATLVAASLAVYVALLDD